MRPCAYCHSLVGGSGHLPYLTWSAYLPTLHSLIQLLCDRFHKVSLSSLCQPCQGLLKYDPQDRTWFSRRSQIRVGMIDEKYLPCPKRSRDRKWYLENPENHCKSIQPRWDQDAPACDPADPCQGVYPKCILIGAHRDTCKDVYPVVWFGRKGESVLPVEDTAYTKTPRPNRSSPLLRRSGIILKMETPGKCSTSTSAYLCCESPGGPEERERGQHTKDQPWELTKARGIFLSALSNKAVDISRAQLK